MEKLKLILVNLVILGVVTGGLYWLSVSATSRNKKRVELVNAGYEYSRGIITDIKSYKGHSLTVDYRINNKDYSFQGGWDKNKSRLKEGDSISIRYSLKDPSVIITELENEY